MPRESLIAGLDIGTTKICAVLAEVGRDYSTPRIVGVGVRPSHGGLRKGVVVNIEQTVQSIRGAVQDAELMAGEKFPPAYVGIAGEHIRGANSKGVIAVGRGGRQGGEIKREDVDRVLYAAQAVSMPADREIIHVLPQEFIVDDQMGIRDPTGIVGVRLEARVHIVTASAIFLQNIRESVRRAGLEVEEFVLEPLASSYSVLSEDERDLGVGLLDVGGGTTDIALFFGGSLRHTAVVGLGGNNVTRDLAIGLRTPLEAAEKIKIEHGVASTRLAQEEHVVSVPGVGSRGGREVPQSELAEIIEPRMEEIFLLARSEIESSEYMDMLTTGIVLTGGGAMLDGAVELAGEVFELPVQLGVPKGVQGLTEGISSPAYATSVGLVLYGIERSAEVLPGREKGPLGRLWDKVKQWWREF
ncbi:MAG TPA: cell division protein FtsA [Candidatus Latescibacteria bacterium]|nr:cell division protein FtsA [Candidatus Latescibacterota bacterium]